MLFQVLTQNRYKANKAYMKLKAKSAAQAKNFALAAQVIRNQVNIVLAIYQRKYLIFDVTSESRGNRDQRQPSWTKTIVGETSPLWRNNSSKPEDNIEPQSPDIMIILQLKHLFTGKFLHINNSETSELEPNNVKVRNW